MGCNCSLLCCFCKRKTASDHELLVNQENDGFDENQPQSLSNVQSSDGHDKVETNVALSDKKSLLNENDKNELNEENSSDESNEWNESDSSGGMGNDNNSDNNKNNESEKGRIEDGAIITTHGQLSSFFDYFTRKTLPCKSLMDEFDTFRKNNKVFGKIQYLPSIFELTQILKPFLTGNECCDTNNNSNDEINKERKSSSNWSLHFGYNNNSNNNDNNNKKMGLKYDTSLLIAQYCYYPNETYFLNQITLIDFYLKRYYPQLNILKEITQIIVYQYIGGISFNNDFIDKIEEYNEFKQRQLHSKSVKKMIQLSQTPLQPWNAQKHFEKKQKKKNNKNKQKNNKSTKAKLLRRSNSDAISLDYTDNDDLESSSVCGSVGVIGSGGCGGSGGGGMSSSSNSGHSSGSGHTSSSSEEKYDSGSDLYRSRLARSHSQFYQTRYARRRSGLVGCSFLVNNGSNEVKIECDKLQLIKRAKKVENFRKKMKKYFKLKVNYNDSMYYAIYDKCNKLSNKERNDLQRFYGEYLRYDQPPSICYASSLDGNQSASLIFEPFSVEWYKQITHNKSFWQVTLNEQISKLTSNDQDAIMKRKSFANRLFEKLNSNSNDENDNNDNNDNNDTSKNRNENENENNNENENKGKKGLNKMKIKNLKKYESLQKQIDFLNKEGDKMAEIQLWESNQQWIQRDWMYNECLKNQLSFYQNNTIVLFSNPKHDFINLKSQFPILPNSQMLINCYILSKADEMWVGLININDYAQRGFIEREHGALMYYGGRESSISTYENNSIFQRRFANHHRNLNDWDTGDGAIHGFGSVLCNNEIPYYQSKDWLSFYINTYKDEQCLKIYKNGIHVYTSDQLPFEAGNDNDDEDDEDDNGYNNDDDNDDIVNTASVKNDQLKMRNENKESKTRHSCDIDDSPLYFCAMVDEQNDGFLIEQVMISNDFAAKFEQ